MRDRRTLFWAALGACLLLAFRPLLRLPFALDDVGILHFWATGKSLLARCLLPHYFRPLAAPVYWTYFELFGANPWGLRALMLALHAATTALVFRLGRRLTRDDGAAALAACLYAFSAIHWSGLSLTAGLAQSLCDPLLWLAVLVYAETRAPARALARALPLATAALLFKEHAVAFAVLAPAARWARRRRLDAPQAALAAAWAAAYAAFRLLGPRSVLSPDSHFKLSWPSAVGLALPPLQLLRVAGAPFLAFSSAAVLGAAAALLARQPVRRARWKEAAAFAAAGLAAGVAPYLFFEGGLAPESPSRLSLACAAAAIGLAACAARAFGRARPLVVGALCAALAVRAAALFARPDPGIPAFSRASVLWRTRASADGIAAALDAAPSARVVALSGFDPELRLAWLLDAADGKRRFETEGAPGAPRPDAVVRLAVSGGKECAVLDGSTGAPACWPLEPDYGR